jgi:chemotaxis protein methyltransferase CheR
MQRALLSDHSGPPQLRPDQVPALAAVAFAEAGLRFDEEKLDFLQTRLVQRVLHSRAGSFRSYIGLIERDDEERQHFIEALTVHTTSFFREDAQYNWLRDFGLPELTQHKNDILLWSAACSTGQEGWTGLMVAEAYRTASGQNFNCRLIGTDISTAVLAQAARAVYFQQDMDSVATSYRNAFFMQARNRDGRCRIIPELRSRAQWQRGNLVSGWGLSGIKSDVAFLRNVLIYFNSETKTKVINRVVDGIRPGGFLLTGHSETGFKHPDLTAVQPSIYQKAN